MRCLRIGVQPIHFWALRLRAGSSLIELPVRMRASRAPQRAVPVCIATRSKSSSSDERPEDISMIDEDVASLFSHAMPKVEIGALKFLQVRFKDESASCYNTIPR